MSFLRPVESLSQDPAASRVAWASSPCFHRQNARATTCCWMSYRLHLLLAALIAGVVFAGGCAGQKKATPVLTDVPFEIDTWQYGSSAGRRIATEHYQIFTTLSDPVLLEALPQAMESAYLFYRELVPTARQPKRPMPVYLFARRGEWASFTRRFGERRARTLLKVRRGGYMERGITVAEYVSHATTFPLLTHEGFHQFLFHCAHPRVPAWLNEGLAVLCEGQRWDGTGLAEFDPWHNPQRRNTLAQALLRDELFTLDELLRINAGRVVGGTTRKISAYYGQVWALVLFLQEGAEGKYAERFARLREAIASKELEDYARAYHVKSPRQAYDFGRDLFCNFISDDLETVEREYRKFMRRRILSEQ